MTTSHARQLSPMNALAMFIDKRYLEGDVHVGPGYSLMSFDVPEISTAALPRLPLTFGYAELTGEAKSN
jgi:hypothetical protein